mgnify:CR=1 FL=1
MKAEHINPFIISVSKIMKDICMLDLKIGKPFIKDDKYEEDIKKSDYSLQEIHTREIVL